MKTSAPPLIEAHVWKTYRDLRLGIGTLALLFPILLVLFGLVIGVQVRTTLSAYYHTVLRDIFVGLLVGIALCLYLYKGFSAREDWALNIAALTAIGVALLPVQFQWSLPSAAPCAVPAEIARCLEQYNQPFTAGTMHDICAAVFFIAISYVALWHSADTLSMTPGAVRRARLRKVYKILGAGMVVFPLAVFLIHLCFPSTAADKRDYTIIIIEVLSITDFAAFWLLKTYELWSLKGPVNLTGAVSRQEEAR